MLADIARSRGFVLSAVTGGFGDELESLYDLGVKIETPVDVRVERVRQREYERHGERIREGGDMRGQHKKFIDFISARPLSRIEQYAQTLTCPIIRIDGTDDYRKTAVEIAGRFYIKHGGP
jgi:hypothetical protein